MKLKAILMIIAGFLLLILAAIGLLIPIWPTTPFVLCSLGCFSASPSIRARLLKIKFVREYSENYQKRCGLSKKTVAISLTFLWGMLMISSVLMKNPWIFLMLFAIGAAVTVHILLMARAKVKC